MKQKMFNSKTTLINFLNDKSQHLKGKIRIEHRKCHDCIILFFDFDDFYDNHR